jgi:hypothetical protein
MTRAPIAALLALLTASCGASLMKLPAGAGIPASDAREALAQATIKCQAVTTLTAEIAVSGSVSGQRLRARIIAGLAAPDLVRLEAYAFNQPIFTFVARGDDATLQLDRENRVLEHGRPDAVLEALTGVPLAPAALRTTLTGCTTVADWSEAQQLGEDWRRIPDGDGFVYLRRRARLAPWQVVAVIRRDASGGEWRAEYYDTVDGLPREIRLSSADRKRFNLRLTLSGVETNGPIEPQAFTLRVPASAKPITLEELQKSGLLGAAGDDDR